MSDKLENFLSKSIIISGISGGLCSLYETFDSTFLGDDSFANDLFYNPGSKVSDLESDNDMAFILGYTTGSATHLAASSVRKGYEIYNKYH